MGGLPKSLESVLKGLALAATIGISSFSSSDSFAQQQKQAQPQKQEPKKLQEAPKADEPDDATQKFRIDQIKINPKFEEDYKKKDALKNPAEKIAVAGSLADKLAQGAENPNNDSALRFVYYREAIRASAEALDLPKAFGFAERLSESHKTNGLRYKVEAFNIARRLVKDADQATSVAESAYELSGSIYIIGDFTSAIKVATDAKALPKLSKEDAQKFTDLNSEITQVKDAELALSANADDPKANETAARYMAFRRGKMKEAKEPAQKSKNQELIDLIEGELSDPDTSDAQFVLGKQYFEASKKMKGNDNKAYREQYIQRADHWLNTAKPRANENMQGDIEKMLKEMGPSAKVTLASLTEGLVGLWLFDEGSGAAVQDSSSSKRNNGKLINGPKWVQGNSGTALSFDGVDDYVSLGVNGMPAANSPQTISWYNFVAKTPNGAQCMVTMGDVDSAVQTGYLNGKLAVWKHGGTVLVSTDPPAPNTWHQYAYTFDGKTHKLYVDGMLKNTSVVEPQTAVPKKLEFGRWFGGSAYFAGNMDEVRIYKRALKEEEIPALSIKKK